VSAMQRRVAVEELRAADEARRAEAAARTRQRILASTHRWERVQEADERWTERMAVPGGWIYAYHYPAEGGAYFGVSMVFVPLPGMDDPDPRFIAED